MRKVGVVMLCLLAACSESTTPVGPEAAVIAHRGASYAAPEHTTAAYDLALVEGADYIEQDIARTSDGVLVVIHDATLDRTMRGPATNCTGNVRQKTIVQLKTCEAGTWLSPQFSGLRILTLDEVLDRYADRARFFIEIKDPHLYPGIENQLAIVLSGHGLSASTLDGRPQVVIQSFSSQSLARMRTIAPGLPLIFLTGDVTPSELAAMLPEIATFADGIAPRGDRTDATLVAASHALCLEVFPYTIDSELEMAALLSAGVNGVFTNRPGLLRGLIDASSAGTVPSPC